MAERYFQRTLKNGMTLLAESMPGVQSGAMALLVPAGSASDPGDARGCATVVADLVLRGAGKRNSRQLTDHLDQLGLQRGGGVGVYHARFGCAAVAEQIPEALPVYADIVRRPHLPEDGFSAGRDLALQSLAGLEDDPRQKLLVRLREIFLPAPLGRNPTGDIGDLKKLTVERCRAEWKSRYQPGGAILAVAGRVDFAAFAAQAEKCFGDWAKGTERKWVLSPSPARVVHDKQESQQTHIGIAWPSVPETDEDYYDVRMAAEVLGGGMSGRLFSEVRERRALCYNIWAGYTSLRDHGAMFAYAGTSNERAQQTLDCLVAEIRRMRKGISAAELDRAKIGLKSAVILQGESSSSRAGSLAHDFFMRGRIRTLQEIEKAIDGVTLKGVNRHLKAHPAGDLTVVIVGPRKLVTP